VKGSDMALLGAIGLAFLIQLVVYYLLRSYPVGTPLFWFSYALWALLGFLMLIRRAEQKRKSRDLSIAFVVFLLLTLELSNLYPTYLPVYLAFEGFFLGLALYAVGILASRHR
jgi:hypothetical protein